MGYSLNVAEAISGASGGEVTLDDATVRRYLAEAAYTEWYDTLQTDPDSFTWADLAIPCFLDAPPHFGMVLNGLKGRHNEAFARINSALSQTPSDVPLAEWVEPKDDQKRLALIELFQATTGGANESLAGFGPARCTKLLHRKRPHLIPIIDSYARMAWRGTNRASWTTAEMADITIEMGFWLRKHKEQVSAARMIAAEERPTIPLSDVRVYDILQYEWFKERKIDAANDADLA